MIRTFLILILFTFFSCNFFLQNDKKLIAVVYGSELFYSDLSFILSDFGSEEDSIIFVDSWIENWVKEQLMIHHSKKNLPDDIKAINQQVEEYQNQLIIYQYQNAMIKQKMDTTVYDYQIEEYYSENKKNFELKDHIVQMLYIKVNKNAPNLSNLKKWYLSDKESEKLLLEEYCYQFADEFSLDDTTWVYFSDVLGKTSLKVNNVEAYLKFNNSEIFEDSSGIYMLRFRNYRIKSSISPLVLQKERIKDIILNERKLEFLRELESNLYQNALSQGKIQYEKN